MKRRRKGRGRRSDRHQRQKLGLRLVAAGLIIGVIAVLILRWMESPPQASNDACAVFREKPSWYTSLKRSEKAWGVPKTVLLAILFQESSFRARVRPPRRKILWILPWRRPSTAYGYGQVLDGTWEDYQRQRKRADAKRSSFDDVADFVGWYADQIHQETGIEKTDAYNLYLAYHEGPAGYTRGSHRQKAWLLSTADKVAARARRYQEQLSRCEDSLRWARLLRRAYWLALLVALVAGALIVVRWKRRSGSAQKLSRRRRKRP